MVDGSAAGSTQKAFNLDDIKDMPVSITIFAGSIEGDRVTYATKGETRAVLVYGSIKDILNYTLGNEVTLTDANVPAQYRGKPFKRNVDQRQQDAVRRIQTEMHSEKYTTQVNNTVVTLASTASSYLGEFAMVQVDGTGKPCHRRVSEIKPNDKIVKQGTQELRYIGGVEIVISAMIIPGYDTKTQ